MSLNSFSRDSAVGGGDAPGERPAALGLASRLEAVTTAIMEDLRRITRTQDDALTLTAAISLRRCGASAALPALAHLHPLLCDPTVDPERAPRWTRVTLGRNSPLGQAEGNLFKPPYPDSIRETIAAILAGTEDAGCDAGDGRDDNDVTQDHHRVPLTLALLLDRGDTEA